MTIRSVLGCACLLAACSSTGVPEGHGWTCLDYDQRERSGETAHHTGCMRSAAECARSAADAEQRHAAGADDPPRWNHACAPSATAWCVSFRDVNDSAGETQSMCGRTREDCEYFRGNRFLRSGSGQPRFADVSECRSFD
jgi:hypothetical protein